MMKKILFLFSAVLVCGYGQAQVDCEQIAVDCSAYLNDENGDPLFVSDGQVYTAFLDREEAEFKTTLYGGSTYRVAASAGRDEDYVIFYNS